MVVKNQIKLIKSLQQKKYRTLNLLFVVEGFKTVHELLESDIVPYEVYTTDDSLFGDYGDLVRKISEKELKQMSGLKNPNKVLGVFRIPESRTIDFSDWILAVDGLADPGNLGTIIRLCDWFGIRNLICSKNTVDCYNPKVLQATMGSIARINILYDDLSEVFKKFRGPIYGTFMDGDSVYTEQFSDSGIIVMGNEANGISKKIENLCHRKIGIPRPELFQKMGKPTDRPEKQLAESLNVATATAIILNEIRRK